MDIVYIHNNNIKTNNKLIKSLKHQLYILSLYNNYAGLLELKLNSNGINIWINKEFINDSNNNDLINALNYISKVKLYIDNIKYEDDIINKEKVIINNLLYYINDLDGSILQIFEYLIHLNRLLPNNLIK